MGIEAVFGVAITIAAGVLLGKVIWRRWRASREGGLSNDDIRRRAEAEDLEYTRALKAARFGPASTPAGATGWSFDVTATPVAMPASRPRSLAGRVFRIRYADADGELTDRVIEIQAVRDEGGRGMVDAFCRLRGAERQFRVDRIISMVDHESGEEIYRPAGLLAWSAGVPSPDWIDQEHESVMQRARPGLIILSWMARHDGVVSEQETQVLLDFIEERCAIGNRGGRWDRTIARQQIRLLRPTLEEAKAAAGRIRATKSERELVRRFLTAMATADGDVTEAEQKRIDTFAKAMGF